ncbi:Maf family protein [Lachnospiraceae bacterium 66-29]
MGHKLILASASLRRKELLEQIGADFKVLAAKGEETAVSTKPERLVLELSAQKASEVAESLPAGADNSIVLGADTIVAFQGEILGKPKNEEDAARMLQMLCGNTHSVYTGVTVIIIEGEKQQLHSFYEETKVTMYPMTERQISSYINTGEPMDKAGAYGIQGKFAVYIEKIDGDYNNVVGLPVARVYQELRKFGIDLLEH